MGSCYKGKLVFSNPPAGCEEVAASARMTEAFMSASEAKTPEHVLEVEHAAGARITARAAIAELGGMVLAVELIAWVVPLMGNNATAYGGLAFVLAVLMVVCFLKDQLSPKQLGIRLDNFIPALGDLFPFLLVFVLVMVSVGLVFGSVRLGDRFWSMLAVVPPWALLQQYMLLAFANRRFQVLFGRGEATAIATAILFAALHLPNPALTLVCGLGGYIWSSEYASRPNLFANALTHTVASAFLANTLPHSLLKNMVVGYNHFLR